MEITVEIDNIQITQVISGGLKTNTVLINHGDYLEEIFEGEDYNKAFIALHNYKIENDIFN